MNVFIARQPIFDAASDVFGYELLYRSSLESEVADSSDTERMSVDVVVQSFLELGLESITRGRTGFINFGREMLVARSYELLPAKSVVIELLENVSADEEVEAACRHLVAKGYTLALDDFVPGGPQSSLIPHASIIKIDVLGLDEAGIRARVAAVARESKARLLAEKIETRAVHHACHRAGFQLFQGYFYSRPEIVNEHSASVAQVTMIKLMNLLGSEKATDSEIEEAFRHDASLSYKLLRMLSTAAHTGRGVDSILHAIRLLGRGTLQRWLSLLLASSFANTGTEAEVVHAAVLRARFCELLGTTANRGANGDALFLVGLFSLMDALLKTPIIDVLARVDLSDAVREALLERTGPYASILKIAEAYESGDWDVVHMAANDLRIALGDVCRNYVHAVEWSQQSVAGTV